MDKNQTIDRILDNTGIKSAQEVTNTLENQSNPNESSFKNPNRNPDKSTVEKKERGANSHPINRKSDSIGKGYDENGPDEEEEIDIIHTPEDFEYDRTDISEEGSIGISNPGRNYNSYENQSIGDLNF